MPDESPRSRRDLPLIRLLPNLLTLTGACAGLTGIRFAVEGEFEWAVRLVLVATVLDGLDGRLARMMRSQSLVGAELDSLADFLSFGVAPALILYMWSMHEIGGFGWIAALTFSVCCLLRLARFNVGQKSGTATSDYFQGVPSPAGAILVFLPMIASFAFKSAPVVPAWATAIFTVCIGLLMISEMRTYSFKNLTVSRANVRFALIAAVLAAALLFIYTWAALLFVICVYAVSILVALRSQFRTARKG